MTLRPFFIAVSGRIPNLRVQSGQSVTVQFSTSLQELTQQSKHFCLIARIGVLGSRSFIPPTVITTYHQSV